MKTTLFLSFALLSISAGTAQTLDFTLADPQPDLIDVYAGSFASGDIDGDGDSDLLMAGLDPGRETAFYTNDGAGNFTEVTNNPFPEASDTVTLFEDLDGDGDLDLYFSGNGFNIGEFAHIYVNDGLGTFTQLANPSLPEFAGRGAAIEDVDGDGDLDIMISARDGNGNYSADVYLNDGNANFTPLGSSAFTPLKFASIAFIDIENDGDADVFISGEDSNDFRQTSLYINDGVGNYSLDTSNTFEQISADDVDVADTDNDGDLDVLMSGRSDASEVFTLLYANDGTGTFTEVIGTNLQQTFAGTNAIADLDNDGDLDIVIIGSQNGGLPNIFNKVYQNMGNNEFIDVDTIGGEYIAACIVDDFNGDDLLDIIIQGFVEDTNVYWNTSTILSTADEIFPSQTVSIYPNPSNGILNLVSNNTVIQNVSMYNAIGMLVDTKEVYGATNYQWAINQPTGVYFVLVTTDKATETHKLILN